MLLDVFGALILAITAIYFVKRLQNHFKAIFFYSIFSFLFEIIANYYAANRWNNHLIFIIFFLIETFLISYFYFKYFKKMSEKRIIVFISIIIFAFMLLNLLNSKNELDDIASSVQSIGFIAFSLLCYYNILSNQEIKNLLEASIFWINTAIIIYFSGKFFVFLFITKVLDQDDTSLGDFWYIITYLLFIFRLILTYAITKIKYNNLRIN